MKPLVEPFLGAYALAQPLSPVPLAPVRLAPVVRSGEAVGFSPVAPCRVAELGCPVGNTGQNVREGHTTKALIDYCTLAFSVSRLHEWFSNNGVFTDQGISEFVEAVYPGAGFKVGQVQEKFVNYCPLSARIHGPDGTPAGHFCIAGDSARVMIDLTGAGCRWVQNWHHVAAFMDTMGGRLTHADCAVDDYDGSVVSIRQLKALAESGAFKNEGAGAPPVCSFHDDMGSDKGCSLYVGQRGHKQLNCYEKGKQLGDPSSEYVRVEVRLYGKHLAEKSLPSDVLRRPYAYVVGAYDVLAELFAAAETSRPKTVKAQVEATVEASVSWLGESAGAHLNLLRISLGDESFLQLLTERVQRDKVPGRFRGLGAGADLGALVRDSSLSLLR